MSASSADTSTGSIQVRLTPEQLQRLDDLRAERNLSRDQLLGELIERAKPRRVSRRVDSGRQQPNPWAQAWPGGRA